MSAVEIGLMLTLGLLSSLHCAQMCGPIVVTYSLASNQGRNDTPAPALRRWASLPGHLAYNAGRILTYAVLGAVAGVLGQSMTWIGRLAGFSHTASIIAGVMMIVGGIAMMGWLPAIASLGQSSAAVTSRCLRPLGELLTSPKLSRRFALGMALGFLPCGLIYAALIFRLAWRGLLHGAIRMEALLALGIGSAYFYSCLQAFRGGQHLYFDTVSVIVMLVLAGKLIERGAKERTTNWIATLHRLAPNKARILAGGVERFVTVQALEPGTLFVVKAGERVPADAVVVEGTSHADESLLTGESAPVEKRAGDTVVAGSVNLSGVLQVRALRTAGESALAQIIAQVERALNTGAPVERIVDRVSRVFVPSVIVVAGLTFAALTWLGGGAGNALMRAIAVLVIACPCALGLATPLAITSAMGIASRNGVLISDSRVLETLQKLDVMVLDKTGTVTEGRFSVVHHESLAVGGSEVAPQEAIGLAASLEQYSEHPLGKALTGFARRESIPLVDACDLEVSKGRGITGTVAGRRVFVGSRKLVEEYAPAEREWCEQRAGQWEREGHTVAFYGWDGQLHGLLGFGDRVRSEAKPLVKQLRSDGIEVQLVSGDSESTTQAVAREIGFDSYRAEVLPDGKGAIIRELQRRGKTVAMVGDGINDAPALAASNLGIAMGTGTDLAMKAAAVVLMDGTLEKIPAVLGLARKTMRVIRQNLFWAFFYNTLGIVLAITGVLNPILAAAAMLLSSVSVIGNTMRLRKDEALQESGTII